jgi:hypothetical protein
VDDKSLAREMASESGFSFSPTAIDLDDIGSNPVASSLSGNSFSRGCNKNTLWILDPTCPERNIDLSLPWDDMQNWSWLQAPVAMLCYSIGSPMGIFRCDIWDTSMLDTDTGYRFALILQEAMNYGIEQAGRHAPDLNRWPALNKKE